jgi:hypothetical protein
LLLSCGILPSLKIRDANFSATTLTWQMVLVIGFVGGFMERLVPDLLRSVIRKGMAATAPVPLVRIAEVS